MTAPTLDGLRTRFAVAGDLDAIAALPGLAASTRAVLSDQLAADDLDVEVAVADDRVVAVAMWWRAPDAVHLQDLAVADDHRRRGVATDLVQRGLGRAALIGDGHVTLEFRADQLGPQRLYASLGFVDAGLRANYYPADEVGPATDAVIAWWPDVPAGLPRQEATTSC